MTALPEYADVRDAMVRDILADGRAAVDNGRPDAAGHLLNIARDLHADRIGTPEAATRRRIAYMG